MQAPELDGIPLLKYDKKRVRGRALFFYSHRTAAPFSREGRT